MPRGSWASEVDRRKKTRQLASEDANKRSQKMSFLHTQEPIFEQVA